MQEMEKFQQKRLPPVGTKLGTSEKFQSDAFLSELTWQVLGRGVFNLTFVHAPTLLVGLARIYKIWLCKDLESQSCQQCYVSRDMKASN